MILEFRNVITTAKTFNQCCKHCNSCKPRSNHQLSSSLEQERNQVRWPERIQGVICGQKKGQVHTKWATNNLLLLFFSFLLSLSLSFLFIHIFFTFLSFSIFFSLSCVPKEAYNHTKYARNNQFSFLLFLPFLLRNAFF